MYEYTLIGSIVIYKEYISAKIINGGNCLIFNEKGGMVSVICFGSDGRRGGGANPPTIGATKHSDLHLFLIFFTYNPSFHF